MRVLPKFTQEWAWTPARNLWVCALSACHQAMCGGTFLCCWTVYSCAHIGSRTIVTKGSIQHMAW